MRVERAGTADICELVEMRLAYLREDNGHLDDADVEAIERDLPEYLLDHLDRDLFVYVVREDGAIASCAFLLEVIKPMSPAFINGRTAIVLNVYTRPQFRRKGYASKTMKALLDDAKAREISVVELQATDDGYPLYLSVGFLEEQSKYHRMKWFNQ